MDPRIWKSHLVDKLTVLIIHAHHDEDAIVKVAVWDAFWADVKKTFLLATLAVVSFLFCKNKEYNVGFPLMNSCRKSNTSEI